MKALTILMVGLSLVITAQSHAATICQSMSDPGFRIVTEGYGYCPSGYYMVGTR